MTGKTKTALVLVSYFVLSEAMMIQGALLRSNEWGFAISAGLIVGIFSILTFRKKTWARHLILLFMGFKTINLFFLTFGSPSVFSYALLAIYAFLFSSLCWHIPILDFLGVPQHKKTEPGKR